ncbi:MAG TPA: transglycosylase domain-containing protein [Acidimicrobiales bacterium]|nr:transglycosylase domain-containing protein [Acidimicrobiales bacterium]
MAGQVIAGTARGARWRWPRPFRGRVTGRRAVKVLLAVAVVLFVVALVAPLRRAAALGASKVILTLASPLAPGIGHFKDLPQASKIVAADGTLLTELDGSQRRQPVHLKDLPPQVPHAVLAAEDANFYHHGGVDPTAVVRAVIRTGQGYQQGGSTITQQLAKINYTNSQRTLLRKLREVQYAVRLERSYTKDELLERYLNQVYFGDGAYGIAAAAQTFFGVPPEQLTPAQAATLAGKIRSPEGLDPRRDPAAVQSRRDQVLRNMRKHRWLDDGELQQSLATPLTVVPEAPTSPARGPVIAPHFVEYVKREAAGIDALGGSAESRGHELFTGGYTIETTLNPQWYDQAVKAVQGNLGGPTDPATAVVSVEPGDGAIRMLFGGLSFDRKFDVASQGRRQPGSSFKPYVYLAAVRDGISPQSRLSADSPRTLKYRDSTFTVHNYEGEGHGKVDLDTAMAHSINVVYSQLALSVGLDNVVNTAEGAGIPKNVLDVDRQNPAVALGGITKGVTPLEQAAAYATFAAKGVFAEPYSIARIRDRSGRVIYTHDLKTHQAFDAKEVGVLNAALQRVVEEGTGTAAQIKRPSAGKTGTTENHGDAWYVGFVPQLSTAVWVGYVDKVTPMINVHGTKVTGGSFPARIWAGYMGAAVEGMPVQDIDTATPDDLSLRILGQAPPTVPQPTTTSSSSTTTSSSTTSTSELTSPTTALPATTTTAPPATTTTTAARATTTTTAPPATSTTTTSTTTASPP